MNDKELLELAAKAAGITGWQSKHGYWNMQVIGGDSVICCDHWPKYSPITGKELNATFADAVAELNWNPLTDDGDELRLEVALKFTAAWEPMRGGWSIGGIVGDEFRWLAFHADRRIAGTRAAAEIGKGMP